MWCHPVNTKCATEDLLFLQCLGAAALLLWFSARASPPSLSALWDFSCSCLQGSFFVEQKIAPVAAFQGRQSQPHHTAGQLLLLPAGTIPASLANCSNFVTLDLTNNSFSGTIPRNMGNIQTLTYMMLSGNRLTGEACTPTAWTCHCAGGHQGLGARVPHMLGLLRCLHWRSLSAKECANGGMYSAGWHHTPWTGRLAAEDCASEARLHALVASTHHGHVCRLLLPACCVALTKPYTFDRAASAWAVGLCSRPAASMSAWPPDALHRNSRRKLLSDHQHPWTLVLPAKTVLCSCRVCSR